jgi:hypothetical protein
MADILDRAVRQASPAIDPSNLTCVHNFRQLRSWEPHGRRSGPVRHQLRMRLPGAIYTLDDGTEVLADRRNRPILERPLGHTTGVWTSLTRDEMWARSRSEIHLDGPVDRLWMVTEDDRLAIAEAAFRYFGINPGDPEKGVS